MHVRVTHILHFRVAPVRIITVRDSAKAPMPDKFGAHGYMAPIHP